MQIKALAEQRASHRRALDVPARAARAIVRWVARICGLIGLGALPQHEVERIFLAVEHGDSFTGTQLVDRFARQLAVARELANRKIDIAIRGLISQSLALEHPDHGQHVAHVFGGAWLVGWSQHAERVEICVHGHDHLVGQLTDQNVAFQRAPDDLVVDVGHIAHVSDLQTRGSQPSINDVERDHHAGMSDVTKVVDRDSTHVHAQVAGFDWNQRLGGPGQGVVDA